MQKIGILGLGAMGMNHLRVVRDQLAIYGVSAFDIHPDFLETKIPGVYKHNLLDEFLEEKKNYIYFVVATPTFTHSKYLHELIARDCNVLVEKPITKNLEEGLAIREAVKSSKSVITVGQIERFNSAIVEAKKRIEEGVLGSIFQIQTVRQGPYPMRITDVGVLADLATHDIDLIHHLTGDRYEYVFADMKFKTNEKNEDLLTVMGKTINGISVLHSINWLSPVKERSIVMMGDKGTLFINCLLSELTFHENASVQIEDKRLAAFRGVSEGNSIKYAFMKREALLTQHENFIDVLNGKDGKIVPVGEALNTLSVMKAINRSYASGEKEAVTYV